MSRTISAPFATALKNETTSLTRIWTLNLANGQTLRFTELVQDFVIGEETFLHDPGIEISALQSTSDTTSNATVKVNFKESLLDEDMVRRGQIDNATVYVHAVDWAHPEYGKIALFHGAVGDIEWTDAHQATINLKSYTKTYANTTGEVYSRTCRAKLGDGKCKFAIDDHALTFTVRSVAGNGQTFTALELVSSTQTVDGQPVVVPMASYFDLGTVEWTGGQNAGLYDDVKTYTNTAGSIELALTPRFPIAVGDTGKVRPGCDKTVKMCFNRFNNLQNFRGEPFAPPPTGNMLGLGFVDRMNEDWGIVIRQPTTYDETAPGGTVQGTGGFPSLGG